MASGIIGAASAVDSLAPTAEAATTYVSTKVTAPEKGQTNGGVKALQQRLIKAEALDKGWSPPSATRRWPR